jgi:hypothetical protein|tara:strand:+ start:299 stop:1234 length:936 start_codon:yes stop_codon:yes gene_type:complete
MANTFLIYTNDVLAKMNEVQLTSSDFSSSRGVQTQAKNAVNQAIRYINQREFTWPFNASEASKTLTAGITRYSLPTSTKWVNYSSFRVQKSDTLGNATQHLSVLDYHEYLDKHINQEDEVVSTALNGSHTDSVTTITVDSTSGFDSTGTIVVGTEEITYTGTSSTTFTGATRGAGGTTAAAHSDDDTVTQFDGGSIPTHVFRTPDDRYGLFPYPNKAYTLAFDYYTFPTSDLSAHGDTTTIPDRFKHIITDGAVSYMYLYRSEVPLYERSFALFNEGIKFMQTLLINRYDYMRSTYIPRSTNSAYTTSSSF